MLKAMLIIGALSGVGGDHKIPMETMEECLDARVAIEKQDSYISTICIPAVDERDKIEEFFELFRNMINEMKRDEVSNEFDRLEQCDRRHDKCITDKQSFNSILRNRIDH